MRRWYRNNQQQSRSLCSQSKPSILQTYRPVTKKDFLQSDIDTENYFPVEKKIHHLTSSRDYRFVKECYELSRNYPSIIQDVVTTWRVLFDYHDQQDWDSIKPLIKKEAKPFKRFTFPQCDKAMRKIIIKEYPHLSWLPENTELKPLDVLNQDRAVMRDYFKYKGFRGELNPKIFLDSLLSLLKSYGHDSIDGTVKTFDEHIVDCNKNSSSCYPLFRRKSDPTAIEQSKEVVDYLFSCDENNTLAKLFENPIIIFHRFSTKVKIKLKTLVTKIRLVFGYPFCIHSIADMLHGRAINQICSSGYFTVGLTRPEISKVVQNIRQYSMANNCNIMALDIKSIDMNITIPLMLLVHAILINIYVTGNRSSSQYSRTVKLMMDIAMYELHGPTLGSFKSIVFSNGGTKSGTRFNTITNSITLGMVMEYFYRSQKDYNGLKSIPRALQSDDGIMPIFENTIPELYRIAKLFNCVLHPEKTESRNVFETIKYLGMNWDIGGEPDNPLDWVVSKLTYPEKFMKTDFASRHLIRGTSILFQIKSGLDYFNRLIVKYNTWIKRFLKRGEDVMVAYVRESYVLTEMVKLPLSVLLEYRWKLF